MTPPKTNMDTQNSHIIAIFERRYALNNRHFFGYSMSNFGEGYTNPNNALIEIGEILGFQVPHIFSHQVWLPPDD